MTSTAQQHLMRGLLIAAAYFFSAKFGLSLAYGTAQVTTVWPPAGIALACLLLLGYRFWPAIFVGAFLANVTTSEPAWVAALIAVGNTLEALVGAAWLRRVKFRPSFREVRDVWIFIGVALVIVLIASMIGVTCLALGREIAWSAFSATSRVWYLGDLMGILIIAPVIFLWPRFRLSNPFRKQYWGTLAMYGTILLTQLLTYLRSYSPTELIMPRAYQAFPLVIWAAVKTSPFGTAVATLAISIIAVIGTTHGRGPFTQEPSVEANLIQLQSFLLYVVATGLTLAAVVAERRALNRALRGRSEQLEGVNRDLQTSLRQRRAEAVHLKDVVSQLEHTKGAMLNLLEDLEQEKDEVSRAKARMEAIVMGVGEGLVVIDDKARIMLVNEVFERLTGWPAHEAIGRSIYDVIPSQDENGHIIQEPQRRYQQVLQTGKSYVTTLLSPPHYYVARDGHRFPVALSVTPMRLNGKIVGAVNVFRDITHEQDVDRAKTEFVSLASHELRTPLTIVRWSIDMLQKYTGPLTDPQRKYVAAIERTGRQMVHLVDALLNVSRIEMGTLNIEPVPTKLKELIHGIVDELKPLTIQNKIQLQVAIDPDLPTIILDPQLIRVVLTNLLTNAIKYTPPKGRVTVGATRSGDHVTVAVSDTGYGIPASEQPKIFTKLFRAKNVQSHEVRGTGLGLYVTKAVVEQSGGKIWFTSKENEGTTFTFELPIAGVPRRPGSKALSTG